MTSPEWPKWEFRDGRKRMTLPIDDGNGEKGDGDMTTPKPIRLNSTESALKKTKSEGEKVSTPSTSRRRKSSKGRGEWMSKEATQREIRARRSIDSLASTVPDQRSIDFRPETLADTVPDRLSIISRPETLLHTVPDRLPSNSRYETLGDTVPDRRSTDSRSETVPETVPENGSTAGGRPSIDLKKKSSTPLRALENVKRELKKDKEKPSNLPDPLSELMLEREKSIRREEKVKKRRGEQNLSNLATTAAKAACNKGFGEEECIPRPSEARQLSLFFPPMRTVVPQRRTSLEFTVVLPDWSILESEGTDMVDNASKKITVARSSSISPVGAKRDGDGEVRGSKGIEKMKSGEGEKKAKPSRRFTEGGAIDNWAKPSIHDFRPSWKQGRKSTEAVNDKETTVVVRRESTSVVPATPMGSEKEGAGESKASLISPSTSDFVPLNGRKTSVRNSFFGEKINDEEEEGRLKVKPETQLSWGRLASAIYRKTSMRSEVSIGSTIPGEFEEEEVELERERERMNSITSQNSDTSETGMKGPVVNRFLSSISLATTRGPSDVSVVKDSLEEEDDEPNNTFKPLIIEDESPPDEFEIKDTVQEGAPKELKFTKHRELGLFRRPVAPRSDDRRSSPSPPPPPSRQSSGGSAASANPRGRRQNGGGAYVDKLSKQLEKALSLRRSDRTLLKHDNSSVTSALLTVEEDRSSGWGVSLSAHSRGYLLLQGNTALAEGSCVRVALPLQRVLESVAVAPTVL